MDDEQRQQLARATRSLQAWLDRLEFSDLSRQVVTATITAEVVAWAKMHRFETRQEVDAVATKRKPYGRNIGLLDVVCTHPSGQQIAVEVDFTNKIWSIEKLAAEADTGKLAIWVKWGGPASLSLIPEKIGVVELHVEKTNQAGHVMYTRTRTDVPNGLVWWNDPAQPSRRSS